jgi:hypothetical protein
MATRLSSLVVIIVIVVVDSAYLQGFGNLAGTNYNMLTRV